MNGELFVGNNASSTQSVLWKLTPPGTWIGISTGITQGADHVIARMVYADRRYVFLTNSGVVFTSDDLVTFTYRQTLALSGVKLSIAYNGTAILISGGAGFWWRSTDNAVTWTKVAGSGGIGVASVDGRFIAVRGSNTYTSPDGLAWTLRHTHPTDITMDAIAAGGNRAVAFGQGGTKIMISLR